MEGFLILASCEFHFNRVHENLVQHPNNNISIEMAVGCRLVSGCGCSGTKCLKNQPCDVIKIRQMRGEVGSIITHFYDVT